MANMSPEDSWFDKVPGNYYKAKDDPRQRSNRNRGPDSRDRRRYSDEYDRQDNYGRNERRRRDSQYERSSIDRDRDRPPRNQRRQEGNRYEDYDRRPSSFDQPRPNRAHNSRGFDGPLDERPEDRPVSPFTAAAAGAASGIAAAQAAEEIHAPTPRAPGNEQPSGYNGYVPYAHIYGSNNRTPPQAPFSPPPLSSVGSVQPNSMNQMTTSRRNPFSPNGSIDGAVTPVTTMPQQYPQVDGAYDRYEHEYPEDRLPYRGRDHSYDSEDDRDRRRTRSERRSDRSDDKRERGKSESKLKTTFDKSQRGVGYGAVGAIAGGLIGSEIGKGAVPTAIGAVLGGLGANMFEARERRREAARNDEFAKDSELTARRERREQERRASTISD